MSRLYDRNSGKMYGNCYEKELLELNGLVYKAIGLVYTEKTDAEALAEIGDGWVAEETLAVALYCTLRYLDDFEAAMVASVNHSGDSDSTGAVTGNLMGAILGYDAIPVYYKEKLELRELIESMAYDLYTGCIIDAYSPMDTAEKWQWEQRYVYVKVCGLKNTKVTLDSIRYEVERYATASGRMPLYTLYGLKTLLSIGEKLNYLFFWGHHTKNSKITKSCLSQWWPCSFHVEEQVYSCMEQYMMAEKARIFGDEKTRELILRETAPEVIKALGREVMNFDESVWDQFKYIIVLDGNYHKFIQNRELKDFLLGTGDDILVEASPYDTVWGIGLKEADPDVKDPFNWKGANLLGFALMQVRDILKEIG